VPPIIGIDLRTTNSVVAYVDYRTGWPRIIPDRAGAVLLPSIVSLGPEGPVVGADAARCLKAEGDATPPQVAAALLSASRQRAEAHFGAAVTNAVIAVPVCFDDDQRAATRDAGRIAGFEMVWLIDDATAATLGYGLHRRQSGVVAVYDLGAGTFEVSLLRVPMVG
jgi:molecular chaperone DnaK (HSP70)